MVLNARDTAIPFYLHLGYELVGEPFVEVGIPHRKMRKALRSS
jgi:predicted GNAT family N-acyltransferase